ncbi:MAG TPA: secondary thiamine-phosphate synthase enzyme YjbQ [Actinomycetota bacterium]
MRQRTEPAFAASFDTTGETRAASFDIALTTTRTTELIDITEQVAAGVAETDLETGIALISTPHTTCAVIVNESESGFVRDFQDALERLAPIDAHYAHNDAPHAEEFEAPNGYAHIRSAFLASPSVMLPVRDGELGLGRWQRVFFVELDRARPRTVQVTVLGRSA